MKKTVFYLISLLAVTFAVSCNKEIHDPQTQQPELANPDKIQLVFNAGSEATKSILDAKTIKFETTDKLAVFDGVGINEFTVAEISEGGNSAIFCGEAAQAANYALVLPAVAMTAANPSENHVSIKIVSRQYVDSAHHIDPAATICTAIVSDGADVSLRNQFSLVKVTITRNDIASVTLMGNNNEIIGGTHHLSVEDGSILPNASGTSETLYFNDADGNPAAFVPGDYYIAIWPTEFTKGFTLKMKTVDESIGFKATAKALSFPRNGGMILGNVDESLTFAKKVITNAQELKDWAQYSNYWENGDEFELGADIDLQGYDWPTVPSFAGSLDGKGFSITNLTVSNAVTRTGFIGTLAQNGELKNITFGASGDASSITLCQSDDDNWCYGGIIGYIHEGAVVEDVTTYVPVSATDACTGKHSFGAIAGNMKKNTVVKNCVNRAAITDRSSYSSSSASGCIAGIVGMSDSAGSVIESCNNYGAVYNYCTGTPHMGGIVGRVSGAVTIKACTNNGIVENHSSSAFNNDGFNVFAGGIAGVVTGSGVTVEKCLNHSRVICASDISSMTTRVGLGGIVGGATASGLQILGCINDATVRPEFTNTKDVAVGGIIGYSSNTIKISKASDGTLTQQKAGYTQKIAQGGTAYVGGIAGLLDNSSKDNIIEYCSTASGYRFEFNDLGGKYTANVGGIVGATKGVVTNCTNNLHIYCRSSNVGYPTVYYGGICGSYSSSRTPLEISYCTNNGNIGAYGNKLGEPCFGGILCALYPDKTVVKFCTNKGSLTTGQALANGGIKSIQSTSGYDMGAICGDIAKPASGTTPITNLEGCVIDCKIIAQKEANYKYYGLICGWLNGTKSDTGLPKIILGTTTNPIQISNTTRIETGTNADPTVETVLQAISSIDDAKKFIFGPWLWSKWLDGSAGKGNFTSIDGTDFTDRFELNISVGSPSAFSTESFN